VKIRVTFTDPSGNTGSYDSALYDLY
jgi:hypothetical protein